MQERMCPLPRGAQDFCKWCTETCKSPISWMCNAKMVKTGLEKNLGKINNYHCYNNYVVVGGGGGGGGGSFTPTRVLSRNFVGGKCG